MWILTRGKVVEYDTDNQPVRMVGTHTDITGLKNAELKLKENQRILNTLIDNLDGMVYRCLNDPNWTMVYLSDGVLSLTGYEKEEVLYNRVQSYVMIIHPDDRDMVWNFVQEGVLKNKPYRITYRIICKNGDIKWVWEQGRGIFEDNSLVALEGYIADTTKEIVHQKALEKMEYSLEHLNEGIFWFDDEGRIFDTNISFNNLIRENHDSISGASVFSLPFILPSDSWSNILEKAKDTGSSICDAAMKENNVHRYFRINTSYCQFGDENVFVPLLRIIPLKHNHNMRS
jgi:PAS domain S-box-containing protein